MSLAKVPNLRKDVLRLRAQSDFERVRREGRSWSHRLLVLVTCPNLSQATRVAVIAGGKLGSAVVRNRAKRLMRQALHRHTPRLAPGWDLVLIARAAIVPVRMQDVADALEQLLRQAGVMM